MAAYAINPDAALLDRTRSGGFHLPTRNMIARATGAMVSFCAQAAYTNGVF